MSRPRDDQPTETERTMPQAGEIAPARGSAVAAGSAPDVKLIERFARLTGAVAALEAELRARQAAYLAAAQRPDGGFAGRLGESDCYYTAFGLTGLLWLGELNERRAARAATFVASQATRALGAVDVVAMVATAALLRAAGLANVLAEARTDAAAILRPALEPLRRDDGGYAKTRQSGPSSTYQTFLALAGWRLAGVEPPEAEATAAMLRRRQRVDGGFVELDAMRHSGTSPTAAAIGGLALLDRLDEPTARRAAEFLAEMQSSDGGFRANTRVPFGDLLSTFTALAALDGMGRSGLVDCRLAARFVASLEQPGGGFVAGEWDDQPDVEYTFYGIGALALCAVAEGAPPSAPREPSAAREGIEGAGNELPQ